MSRKQKQTKTDSILPMKGDGWTNLLTGLGDQDRDKRKFHLINLPTAASRERLEAMYISDEWAAKIADLPSQEMVRQWITLHTEDNELSKSVMQYLDDLDVQPKLIEGLTWGAAFGGALAVLGIDDGNPDLKQPLNEKNIKSFGWLTVVDRFDANIISRVSDLMAKNYGEPELYSIVSSTAPEVNKITSSTIHASRCIRFGGVYTTKRRRLFNAEWDDSIYLRLDEILRDYNGAWQSASHLLSDFAQAVFRIKGLANALATDSEDLVLARMKLMDMSRSSARAIPLDEDESFERQQTPITGLPEMLDRFANRLSGACGIPVSLLLGEKPAGLNATGDADIRFFYDNIKSKQEKVLRPIINRILKLVFLSKTGPTKGVEPKEWSFDFNPLWQMDESQVVAIRKTQAEADNIYIQAGVLDPEEVAQSRFGGDKYSIETTLDLEARAAQPEESSETVSPPEQEAIPNEKEQQTQAPEPEETPEPEAT